MQGSWSLLLLVKAKQIISQDIVSYCFFRPLLMNHNTTFDIRCVGNKIHIVKSCTLRRLRKMIVRGTQSTKPIFIIILILKIFASQVNFFREGTVGDHQPVRDVSKFGTNVSACLTQINPYGRLKVASNWVINWIQHNRNESKSAGLWVW